MSLSSPHRKASRPALAGAALVVVSALAGVAGRAAAQTPQGLGPPRLITSSVQVSSRSPVLDLVCPPLQPARPPRPAGAATAPSPWVIPDEDMVREEMQHLQATSGASEGPGERSGRGAPPAAAAAQAQADVVRGQPPLAAVALPWRRAPSGEPFRLAVWGDSHLAAGFFTEALAAQMASEASGAPSAPSARKAYSAYVPASMNRAGVRLAARKTCVSAHWKHEPAHADANAAAAPAPGLVNLSSSTADASLAWDLRNPAAQAEHAQLELLFQQTSETVTIALSVDDGPEHTVQLQPGAGGAGDASGPARLRIQGDAPLSLLRLRLVAGTLRLHGLRLPPPPNGAVQLDVFGWPGATVAGWARADPQWMGAWFADAAAPYHLVMLEFGTNEGNVKPFDAAAYRAQLAAALTRFRTTFPDTPCLLIAPGDRGVLVPRVHRPQGSGRKSGQAPGNAAKARPATPAQSRPAGAQLLRYSQIHARIAQVQADVGAGFNCGTWSMQDAMGGPGSAYTWARAKPVPLMAGDLLHFTPAGYRRLAELLAQDLGLRADRLWEPAPR